VKHLTVLVYALGTQDNSYHFYIIWNHQTPNSIWFNSVWKWCGVYLLYTSVVQLVNTGHISNLGYLILRTVEKLIDQRFLKKKNRSMILFKHFYTRFFCHNRSTEIYTDVSIRDSSSFFRRKTWFSYMKLFIPPDHNLDQLRISMLQDIFSI
jgi:hypothetical protein